MSVWFESLGWWAIDFHLPVCAILSAVAVASACSKQAALRQAIAWSACAGLLLLALLTVLPGWPRISMRPTRLQSAAATRAKGSTPAAASDDANARIALAREAARMGLRRAESEGFAEAQRIAEARIAGRLGAARAAEPSMDQAPSAGEQSLHERLSLIELPLEGPYLAGLACASSAAAILLWLLLGTVQAARLVRNSRAADESLQALLDRVVRNSRRRPRLLLNARITHPLAIGLARPTIILPELFVAESESRLEAALAHEWAHIRHGDLWLLALLRALAPLLAPQPLFFWLRRTIRNDQEELADAAAATRSDPLEYAQALLDWARSSPVRPRGLAGSMAFWDRPSQLKRRLARLLDEDFHVQLCCSTTRRLTIGATMLLAVVALASVSLRPALSAPEDRPRESKTANENAKRSANQLDDSTIDEGPESATGRADGTSEPLPPGVSLRLGTSRFHLDDHLTCLVISPDGAEIAGGANSQIVFWDARTGQALRSHACTHWCSSLAFSPDGRWIAVGCRASGNNDPDLQLVDVATGASGPTFAADAEQGFMQVAYSPDGELIASGGQRTLHLWNATTGEELKILKDPVVRGPRGLTCLVFSPDGKQLAAGSGDGEACIWTLAGGGEPLRVQAGRGGNAEVQSLVYSADSRRLLASVYELEPISGQFIGRIRCFDPTTGASLENELDNCEAVPGQVKLVLSGDRRLLSAARTDRIEIWEFATGKKLATIEEYKNTFLHGPQQAAFSQDGKVLYAIDGHQQTIRRWETATGKEILDLPASHSARIEKLSFSGDGKRIATTSADQTTRLWDAQTGRPLRELPGVLAALSPDGKLAATSHCWKYVIPEGSVRLTSLASGQEGAVFDTEGEWIGPASFSHDGGLLAVASYKSGDRNPEFSRFANQTIHVWDVAKRELRLRMLADDPLVQSFAFSDDGTKLYSVSEDSSVAVWDLMTGKQDQSEPILTSPGSRLGGAAFSRSGGLLAFTRVFRDQQTLAVHAGVWNLFQRKAILDMPISLSGQQCVALSPDGRLLAYAASWSSSSPRDHEVHLWDLSHGREVARLKTGDVLVMSLEFSPDSKRLAGGLYAGSTLVWNLEALEGQ